MLIDSEQWIGRQRIELEGMKDHKLVHTLRLVGLCIIHKQASLQAMNPEEPFHLGVAGAGSVGTDWTRWAGKKAIDFPVAKH